MSASVQVLVADLQKALGLSVTCGQITLNLNDGTLQSIETKTYQRFQPRADKPIRTINSSVLTTA